MDQNNLLTLLWLLYKQLMNDGTKKTYGHESPLPKRKILTSFSFGVVAGLIESASPFGKLKVSCGKAAFSMLKWAGYASLAQWALGRISTHQKRELEDLPDGKSDRLQRCAGKQDGKHEATQQSAIRSWSAMAESARGVGGGRER